MARKKRTTRQRAKKAGYDSGLEQRLAEGPLKGADYHPQKVKYVVPARQATYEPDFRVGNMLVEAKGFFRKGDPKRYQIIASSLQEHGLTLVFVFQDESTKMPGARKRKDGSCYNMREWAEKNNIIWYNEHNCKEIFDNVN